MERLRFLMLLLLSARAHTIAFDDITRIVEFLKFFHVIGWQMTNFVDLQIEGK